MSAHIKKCISIIFEGAGERNWIVQNTIAAKILPDYTSIKTKYPTFLSAEEITYEWSDFLPGFVRTKYPLANSKITITDNFPAISFDGKALSLGGLNRNFSLPRLLSFIHM